MTIYLATDHAGFELKEKIKKFLAEKKYEVKDFGAFSYDENDDYPDFVKLAAEAVSKNPSDRAIVLGGSGQGEAMVANRYKGVRAAVLYKFDEGIIKLFREHNDANVLSLGARFLEEKDALRVVELWLNTPFSGEERHSRRIAKF
ncbi:MAG: ribose-5-phosphate isomerase [Candidatus Harrisonbacteria bacterium RIFOXYA1_FULL_48_8]|uniref:Ribose-5-phosphate isomerase B n=3 Tax=Parcubacteria group TaxID=1794811 RepID=A0A0G1T4Q1_9BACT|nr:MAG: Ribose-5-phosphate isomerase B [Candidatus Giovannonibacteria bacterium GW2011_GWB1_47_6b]OGY65077.1 MAG: ribose-5-phosphate isomerase [Candidatus Harrisonbacteria bacterium RIFCSPHIGHO2_12_FULL_48_16]OGY68309.1 MAG: ribose-5-phosphate isomerase [Candidatus Harrisonbacteria bacterium RIFOXYA1_FULL_48_8]